MSEDNGVRVPVHGCSDFRSPLQRRGPARPRRYVLAPERMTQITATSVIELLARVEEHEPETMFRGQGDALWPLLPSIARFTEHVEGGYDRIVDLEAHLLDKFAQYSVPFQDLRSAPLIERLVHCQHFGLPTRLLDWSTNPLKALFFAVEDPRLDAVDGSVHVTTPTSWWEGTTHIKKIESLSAFFPELLHDRVTAQDACFMAFPFPDHGMSILEMSLKNYSGEMEFLYQVLIPKEAKRDLRRQLAVLGITHRTVYPGLDGVAKWVKSSLSNFMA
jgi:hypothetical protein